MKKNDWILAGAVLAAALCLFLWQRTGRKEGSLISVSVDGQITDTYSLSSDQTVLIRGADGFCRLTIRDGKASVTEASCPDELCVMQKEISSQGETIACLPNRILITVEKGGESDYDAVAQ